MHKIFSKLKISLMFSNKKNVFAMLIEKQVLWNLVCKL